ncbi:hypothetical protein SHKM778_26130 [Streptomyces sp. KM77-8]|uniref:FAD dependent oxidoreductase domain-containing protein n=1 Tax=Streptomyces haneummycinicus TaxID=3074435 RepID=A0AAT9HFX9_9ACTN
MGACALWQLAERGVDAIGIERHQPGHSLGSSHGGSRMFRVTCLEHPGLVPLARRSRELWSTLEESADEQLFFPVGGLLIGPKDGRVAGGTLTAAYHHGIEVSTLTGQALRFHYPRHVGVPEGHIGVREPSAGIIRPELSIRSAVNRAGKCGARVLTDTRITTYDLIPGGVVLRTSQGELRVRQVVFTVGSWLSSLVGGLPLRTVRMPITWYRPLEPGTAPSAWSSSPSSCGNWTTERSCGATARRAATTSSSASRTGPTRCPRPRGLRPLGRAGRLVRADRPAAGETARPRTTAVEGRRLHADPHTGRPVRHRPARGRPARRGGRR